MSPSRRVSRALVRCLICQIQGPTEDSFGAKKQRASTAARVQTQFNLSCAPARNWIYPGRPRDPEGRVLVCSTAKRF